MNADGRPVILAVDDSTDILALIKKALNMDYELLTADNPGDAIALASAEPRPDLILLDVDMPAVSGFEVCRALKSDAQTSTIPVVFVTAKTEAEDQLEGLELGAIDYITKPINGRVLKARVRMHVALTNTRLELESLVKERTAALERSRGEIIRQLGRAMALHESALAGNITVRLAHYAKAIAEAAGMKPAMVEMVMTAAPLHDVGKLGVPAEILRKKEKLSARDLEKIRRHPRIGADIIGEHADPLLRLTRQIALTHHERWDGTGYPEGLKGDAIPWVGRVMAIVDAFESMTTAHIYRDAATPEKAAAEIVSFAGKKYDPNLVQAFQKALPAMMQVREQYPDSLSEFITFEFGSGADVASKPRAEVGSRPAPDVARKPVEDVASSIAAAAAMLASTAAERKKR